MYRTNVLNNFPSLIIDHTRTETKIFEHTLTSSSVKRWLERHASANRNRNRKIKVTKKAELTPLQQFLVK